MRSPLPPTPIWWTEWGVTPTHFNEVSDAVFAGTFLLRGMASCMGPGTDPRVEALSYWVVSDHFEELGRPPALLHGGFGTRTVVGAGADQGADQAWPTDEQGRSCARPTASTPSVPTRPSSPAPTAASTVTFDLPMPGRSFLTFTPA